MIDYATPPTGSEVQRLRRALRYATEFHVGTVRVYRRPNGWHTDEHGHITNHGDRNEALSWAYELAGEEPL